MKALIFGISGQDGYYLSEICRRNDIEVIGVSRSKGGWIKGDVGDLSLVDELVKVHQPDYIFHFAANSTTRHSALFENHEAISTGTLNILEAVRLHSPNSKVLLSGSAMQFENNGFPIKEKTPFAASSPYAVARIQSVYAGRYFREKHGLAVYAGYFFNHDSPRRGDQHVNQKIASFIRNFKENETLEIGDISVKKEFTFAGDAVAAVWKLVNQTEVFEAVIGSGIAYSIEEWLNVCFASIGRNWQDFVETKSDFTPDYNILVSNPALIKSLGWEPEISFEELAKMMLKG